MEGLCVTYTAFGAVVYILPGVRAGGPCFSLLRFSTSCFRDLLYIILGVSTGGTLVPYFSNMVENCWVWCVECSWLDVCPPEYFSNL